MPSLVTGGLGPSPSRGFLTGGLAGPLGTGVSYRVYWDSGTGGPVDFTTPLATTALLTYATAPLAAPGDYTFVVRTLDNASGVESPSLAASFRIALDASGADVTPRPTPPKALTATPLPGGRARVRWYYRPHATPAPTGFRVYHGTPAVSYATPAATLPYSAGRAGYFTGPGTDLTGLGDGVVYRVAVRAYNAAGEETNTTSVAVTGNSVGPPPAEPVSGSAAP